MTVDELNKQKEDGVRNSLKQYFVDITSECPYGMPQHAVYHQAFFGSLPDSTMDFFFRNGYRRNGNCVYSMRCPGCQECIPIRLHPEKFVQNRNQKRVWAKNRDISVGLAPLTMSTENLALLDRFLQNRFPDGRANAESYYSGFFITSMTKCFEIRYRVAEQLLGVAIVDCSDDWLNAVYFYFDPDQGDRSPGTLNILYLIEFCLRHRINHLYLGYWINQVKGMQYKTAFKPHELLIDDKWKSVPK